MSRIAEDAYGDTPAPYPLSPGHRGQETSKEAARKFKSYADGLRAQVLDRLTREPSTVHETAAALRVPVPSIQPRFSELVALEKIEEGRRPSPQERERDVGRGLEGEVITIPGPVVFSAVLLASALTVALCAVLASVAYAIVLWANRKWGTP